MEKVAVLMVVVSLTLMLIVAMPTVVEAGRRAQRQGNRQQGALGNDSSNCSEWTFGPCEFAAGQTCGRGHKQGSRTGDNCPVKQRSFPCRVRCTDVPAGCRYKPTRDMIQAAECDATTGMKTLTVPLTRGDRATCPQSRVIQKRCAANNRRRPGAGRRSSRDVDNVDSAAGRPAGRRQGAAAGRQNRCRYSRGEWSQCDATSNIRTRTLTLRPASPPTCEASRVITKKCKQRMTGGGRGGGHGQL